MGDWIYTTDINGNKGWLNIKTNLFRTTYPLLGTVLLNTERSVGFRPHVKLDKVKAAVKMKNSYNSRLYTPHNHMDESIKLKLKHQEITVDKTGNPHIMLKDFTPKNEAPMKMGGPENWVVETAAMPIAPVKFGVAELAGRFGNGALLNWGRKTILEDAFKNVVDKGLTDAAKSLVEKQAAKEIIPKYNEVRHIPINKSVKADNFTSKLENLKSLKNSNTKKSIDLDYDAFLSQLANEESALDLINSKLSLESTKAAYKYVLTGHAKPLTLSLLNAIAHKVGSDFTGLYIIEPSGLQKAFGKIQINKIENLGGKTEGLESILPVKVGQTVTLYSPKKFILENSNKPSIFGFYPELSLNNPRNVVGMFYPKYDLSTVDPSLTPKSPLYTLIHERSSHGTDDLMSKLKLAFRWKGNINKNSLHTVLEHYLKLVNDIVANNPELNLDGSKLWYELRATNNEITARAYLKVFLDAKKQGKIPLDASINDSGIIDSLGLAYELEIDKLTPELLARVYASVNGYGYDYARSIMNALQKASTSGDNKLFNTFIHNLKSGIKYLPGIAPIGIGLNNQNLYKNGGKMKISFGKSGIHIKKLNEGKFTEYCGGKVTQDCINRAKASGNSKLVKRAVFAENAKHWKHKNGGTLTDNNIAKGLQGLQIPNSPSYFKQYGINGTKFANMWQSLVDKGIPQLAAFDTTWQAMKERPTGYYAFGVHKPNLNTWANQAFKSLTTGLYKAARDSTNFKLYRLATYKYNTNPSYTNWLKTGRNSGVQFINTYRKANNILGKPIVMLDSLNINNLG